MVNKTDLISKEVEFSLASKEAELSKASESINTTRAMKNATKHFIHDFKRHLPCTDQDLKDYLVTYAGKLSVSTLEQRRSLIGLWHEKNGFDHNPNKSDIVRKIMKGIRKKYNKKKKKAKPMIIDVLERVNQYLEAQIIENNVDDPSRVQNKIVLQSLRDRAMILVSFWFGIRSDNLRRIRLCDLTFYFNAPTPYFELYLPYSKKSDDEMSVLEQMPKLCAMTALDDWLRARNKVIKADDINSEQPVFVGISRWGKIINPDDGLHIDSINDIYNRLFDAAGELDHYSSHSFRRGLANWLIDSNSSIKEMMEWIGWTDERAAISYLDGKKSLPTKVIKNSNLALR